MALWNFGLQRLSAEYFRWVDEAFDRLSFEDCPLLPDLHGIAALGVWLRATSASAEGLPGRGRRGATTGHRLRIPARMAIIFATPYAPRIGDPALGPMEARAPDRFLEIVAWSKELGDPDGSVPAWPPVRSAWSSAANTSERCRWRTAPSTWRPSRDPRRQSCTPCSRGRP